MGFQAIEFRVDFMHLNRRRWFSKDEEEVQVIQDEENSSSGKFFTLKSRFAPDTDRGLAP